MTQPRTTFRQYLTETSVEEGLASDLARRAVGSVRSLVGGGDDSGLPDLSSPRKRTDYAIERLAQARRAVADENDWFDRERERLKTNPGGWRLPSDRQPQSVATAVGFDAKTVVMAPVRGGLPATPPQSVAAKTDPVP